MVRSSLARISSGGFSLLLSAALLLMVGGLIASDRALTHAATRAGAHRRRAVARWRWSRRSTAATRLVHGRSATSPRDSTLRACSIAARRTSASAAAMLAGADTRPRRRAIVRRSAQRSDVRRRRSTSPAPVQWTLVVAHRRVSRRCASVLWVLSLATVAILGFGVIRERRQAIRVAERSAELERLYSEVARANHGEERISREHLARAAHAAQRDRRIRRAAEGRRLRRSLAAAGAAGRSDRGVGDASAPSRRSGARHREDRRGPSRGASGDARAAPVRAERGERARIARQRARAELLDRGRRVAAARAHGPDASASDSRQPDRQRGEVHAGGRHRGARAARRRGDGGSRRGATRRRIRCSRAESPDPRRVWVALQVVDTGVGIAPADQARIFEEFEQVNAGPRGDSMQRGTGLGLAISRRLARLLGGDIGVESQLGQRLDVHAVAAGASGRSASRRQRRRTPRSADDA